MSQPFDFDHAIPSIEGIRARLAATPFARDEGTARRPSAITTLLNMLEQRDRRAAEHAFRVAELASTIGLRMDLPAVKLARLRLAALLHDVGKLSVPEEVLTKPGPLTEDEWQRIKYHPEYAFQMIASSVHPEVAETVLKHCERMDGKGYPRGREADEIPTLARIILVADAYDAMLSPRPYRLPFSVGEALGNLTEGAGTQFDPDIVAILVDIAKQEGWEAA